VDEIRSDNRTIDDLPLPVVRFLRSLLDPEGLGWAVTAEVRKEAIKLLGEKSGIKDRYE
jgi:hypothetical protein